MIRIVAIGKRMVEMAPAEAPEPYAIGALPRTR
jgi:hypothetical protein